MTVTLMLFAAICAEDNGRLLAGAKTVGFMPVDFAEKWIHYI